MNGSYSVSNKRIKTNKPNKPNGLQGRFESLRGHG